MPAGSAPSSAHIICWTPDCRDLRLSLVLGNPGKVAITFAEVRYGFPASGARLQAARPDTAMASQSGDETILANTVELPAQYAVHSRRPPTISRAPRWKVK